MSKVFFDFASAESRDRYKLLSGLVVPRPIGWIGTTRQDGSYNLAPFSFFNVVSSDPPVVVFSAGSHRDRPKDTRSFAETSGAFSVNIVSEDVVGAMSVTSGSFTAADDEFEIAGLTAVPGKVVSAPLVAESPANIECTVRDIVDIGDKTQLVVGDVAAIHVSEDVLDGTRIDHDTLRAVGRLAGSAYVRTTDRFEVAWPD